ncbi:hypothetical protein SELMODRAFT_427417 [Selaginella moellendorffii]|uniref:Bifunctional inhibitor/plant lipid transfer protein/seed storage helical domain-containing protein n=1 Tax=Selaginella moellendorffii TaxID=88036 RepID=D8SZI7_SELML|nr:hypothetical protein SELMODRAFT_427417 [Selaginella moellendorffii]
MGGARILVVVALLASLLLHVGLVAAAVDCSAAQQAMFPCLSAAVGGNPPPPSVACCAAMKSVSKLEMCQCLVNQTSTVPGLNMTAARNIPANCNISAAADCS